MFSILNNKSSKKRSIQWSKIETLDDLSQLVYRSYQEPVLIFKHSTRCSISSWILSRFEYDFEEGHFSPYYLDLIAYRDLSNTISRDMGIPHESPQGILIVSGKAVYSASHNELSFDDMVTAIEDFKA